MFLFVYLESVYQPIPSKPQSSHSWFFLHYQEIEWLLTPPPWLSVCSSSIKDGAGVADLQVYSHLWNSIMAVSPLFRNSHAITQPNHVSVNSCGFDNHSIPLRTGGSMPPLVHCSPRFPLRFEKQACRNSLDPQTCCLVLCPPKPSRHPVPTLWSTLPWPLLWPPPIDLQGPSLEEIDTQETFLGFLSSQAYSAM